MYENYLDFSGILLIIVYLVVVLAVFRIYGSYRYKNDPITAKYFIWGIVFKLIVALGFAFIFDIYYDRGGDSYAYFLNSSRLGQVLFDDPSSFFKMFFGLINKNNVQILPSDLEYIPGFKDPAKFFVHRLICLFTIVGLKHFYLTIICLNVFLYAFVWKVFRFFNSLFPDKHRLLAIAFLFVPSVTFWGSGMVKDSFTYTFAFVFVVCFYKIILNRQLRLGNIILTIFCMYIVLSLKPYIFYAALVGMFLWFGLVYTSKIKSRALRVFVLPIAMVLVGIGGMYAITSVMTKVGGAYKDVDSMLNKAVIAQQDLKRDYYKGASFDIGDYDPTLTGALSVTPAAILAGLYRPFIWEARSIVMILSGLENMVLMLLTLYVLFRAGPVFMLRQLSKEPFLVFCFVFSFIMAMGIGLSTSNFGALVRFKIPLIPFFLLGWLFIYDNYRKSRQMQSLKDSIK
ncbi:MAG: hypothetical protein KA793_03300 [Bacteroidales bacterium]|nr:hypothetical protein [Bacteroidales bacterium]